MRRTAISLVLGLLAALLTALGSTALSAPAHAFVDRDCADFATQKAAQLFFLNAGGPRSDPHRLDGDGDGVVCESLPCPCYKKTTKPGNKPKPAPTKKKRLVQHGKVIKVTDGDTVKVRLRSGKRSSVRLLGIDTPEVFGGRQCWGREASAWLKKRLPRGTKVKLVSDRSQQLKDRYGRLLRYVVKKKSGTDMGRAQVSNGNARVYVHGGKKFQRTKKYRAAQRLAKRNRLGLWGAC